MFGGGKELAIHNFGRMNGLCLGPNHICGVVRNNLVVNGRIGGRVELGVITQLLVILVHDKAHQVVDYLLHIVRESEEYCYEIFADLCEVSVGWLPRNGVKHIELCCKQRLELSRIHGRERGHVVGSKADEITQGWDISQDHRA